MPEVTNAPGLGEVIENTSMREIIFLSVIIGATWGAADAIMNRLKSRKRDCEASGG